jgi:hypothetical protein
VEEGKGKILEGCIDTWVKILKMVEDKEDNEK